jgi:TonB family protein
MDGPETLEIALSRRRRLARLLVATLWGLVIWCGVESQLALAQTQSPPPPPPTSTSGLRVDSQEQQALLIHGGAPVYPPLAKVARAQGTVKLSAVIAGDGTVKTLSAISGHPLLVEAAMTAVKQWQYKPTIVNGKPVEVITTIDVNFTLAPCNDPGCSSGDQTPPANGSTATASKRIEGLWESAQKGDKAALSELTSLANSGNAEAQRKLSALYFKGVGVSKDSAQAVSWLRKAADQGLDIAKSALAKLGDVASAETGEAAWQAYSQRPKTTTVRKIITGFQVPRVRTSA